MKKLLRSLLLSTLLFISHGFVSGQAFVADVEAIYGGTIRAITGDALTADSFKLVIATESANSIFYANVTGLGTPSVGAFKVLPAANSAAGFGSGIEQLAYHANSRRIFWGHNGAIYSATETATTATKAINGVQTLDLKIKGNKLLYTVYDAAASRLTLTEGNLDASGNFTLGSSLNINSWTTPGAKVVISKNGDTIYLLGPGSRPQIVRVNAKFNNSLNFSTTTTTTITHTIGATNNWSVMGVAPDGRIFLGATGTGNTKVFAYKDYHETAFTEVATGIAGGIGPNIDFDNSFFGNYYVYCAAVYSNNKGVAGTWRNFGHAGSQTHPNDGVVYYIKDGLSGSIVTMTSDQGLAWSRNGGANTVEINDGIEAVQVNDFDMNTAKTHGWLASKAGVRWVSNYNSGAKTWSSAMFPNGDGSPYYSAEMIADNTNQAYVGNVRIYKTLNNGTTWNQVFTPETAPYNFTSSAVAEAIEVCKYNTNIVMVGYSQNNGDGGCFYSLNGGTSWTQLRIKASVDGPDIDVNDIVFTQESGKIVAYIGVEYTVSHNGVYRAEFDGTSTWTLTQNTTLANSGDGISLPFNVRDLDVSVSGDTVLFVGTSGSAGSGNGFFKIISSDNKWYKINVNTSSLSLTSINAGCLGKDTVFLSQDNKIAYSLITKGTMVLKDYSQLAVGTYTNHLYYDALVAGGSTGFYAFNPIGELPRVSVPIVGVAICSGGTGSINATSNVTGTYKWYRDSVLIPGANSASLSVTQAGTYVAVITASNGLQGSSDEVIVTVNSGPTLSTAAGSAVTFCQGGSVTLTATATATAYQWMKDNSNISGATAASYTATSSGSYTVGATGSNGCTTVSSPITVQVNSLPTTTVTAGGSTSFCDPGSVTLTAASGTGYVYQWLKDNSAVSGATNAAYTATSGGAYRVRVQDGNSCVDTSAATTVTVKASPTATITAASATSFCAPGSVVLNGNTGTGLTYQWLKDNSAVSGATNASYTASESGAYTLRVTNSNSCSTTSASTTVLASVVPKPTISQQADTLISSASSGNQWYLNTAAISGATNQKYKIMNSGTYTLQVTNTLGCKSEVSASFPVVITALSNIDVTGKEWKLYPNPVVGNTLFISRRTTATGKASAQILLQNGRVQSEKQINSNDQMELNQLPAGIYFLRITEKNGTTSIMRFIKL
ncbi:MAG: T9SS type A sorting domain-containing protein [Chitinophagales bacterium]|jgi:hypothetical protein|nr:T9SS type A sorting domain-containing protein [Chitinophagales bacterium]